MSAAMHPISLFLSGKWTLVIDTDDPQSAWVEPIEGNEMIDCGDKTVRTCMAYPFTVLCEKTHSFNRYGTGKAYAAWTKANNRRPTLGRGHIGSERTKS